ncbi:MAG TPA: hypothetical protein VG248_17910 [Caulobacteraceae bacterium]|jgi:hypothetical protein|nr:hypothetical protein [Caulobacteraceae bacterium]
MTAIILALALAGAAASAPPAPATPGSGPRQAESGDPGQHDPAFVTAPQWFKKPTAAEIHAAWPSGALSRGIGGRALMNCRVDVTGVAEDCRVMSEFPAGMGFGAAAVSLAPQLLFKPALDAARRPEPSHVDIPVRFENSGPAPVSAQLQHYRIIDRTRWLKAPLFADSAAAYPSSGAGLVGYAAFECRVVRGTARLGELADCEVQREEPTGHGFAGGARRLLGRFRADTSGLPDFQKIEYRVHVRITLSPPGGELMQRRIVGEPVWTVLPDPQKVMALFPPAAVAAGVRTGRGVARCQVAVDGSLHDCTPGAADPPGVGFAETAAQVASVMKMARWTQAGGPVDGVIDLPIRFNYAAPPAPGAAAAAKP